MFSVQRFFSSPKRWPCQHINPKLFSRSSFAGRAVILEPLLGERFFVALSWFWAKNSWFFVIFKMPVRPSADFGPVDLRKLVVFCDFQIVRATLCGLWAGRPSKTCGFFTIFKSLARPSAEFRVVESLPLWRGAHFLEAANRKPLPSQWDLLQSVLSASSIFNSPARPSAEFGLVDLRKLVALSDFQIARATLCGVSRGRFALVVARRSF